MADPWDAFGEDEDDDDDDDVKNVLHQAAVTFLTQAFVKHNPQINLDKRIVATTDVGYKDVLQLRSVQVLTDIPCDAAIETTERMRKFVVPGGHLLMQSEEAVRALDSAVWNTSQASKLAQDDGVQLWAVQRFACPINSTSCPWKPSSCLAGGSSGDHERLLLQEATVTRSANEIRTEASPLTAHGVSQAVETLKNNGYCIIRSLLDRERCLAWGDAVLKDLHSAAKLLLDRDEIDLYHPLVSKREPQTYREMSMREDLRMDLRDGPQIRRLRQLEADECGLGDTTDLHCPTILTQSSKKSCLRFHPDVISIVQQTMNPTDTKLFRGNFGRHNFGGSGPDGSFQSLRIGPMGGIVSLPSSADQTIHADTPHLFETMDCLPAHYINSFCLGNNQLSLKVDEDGLSTGATSVGGTAFVHSSHKLSFTSSLAQDWSVSTEPKVWQNIVRPSLELGDVVLFDCRILHFGLANLDKDVERPMLYTNMTQAWFHDPKNWNNEKQIFTEDQQRETLANRQPDHASMPTISVVRDEKSEILEKSSVMKQVIAGTLDLNYQATKQPTLPDDSAAYVEPALAGRAHLVFLGRERSNSGESGALGDIYLGPKSSAGLSALDNLQTANVRGIVNCTNRVPCCHQATIKYCTVAVNDVEGADILTYLDGATTFLHLILKRNKSVLVHCEMGVSRSATVVIAYLIRFWDMTRDEAFLHVKARRPQASPNSGFWGQLLVYQDQCRRNDGRGSSTTTAAEAIDMGWAQKSNALFATCREIPEVFQHCGLSQVASQEGARERVLTVCLDFIWGRGVLDIDLEWLSFVCETLNRGQTSEAGAVFVVETMLQDKDSKFWNIWAGEIYESQIQRVFDKLN